MNTYEQIAQYYDTLVNRYGHDPRACDYGHTVSQQIKFSVLSQVINETDKTLLDIGCGFADFSDFIFEKCPNIEYTGFDLSTEMIRCAKELHISLTPPNHHSIYLYQRNILENPPGDNSFDVVMSNGIFYLLGNNAFDIMKEIVCTMYKVSKRIVAFNTLSLWAPNKEENEFYADPLAVLSFCHTITPYVTLRHDYHQRDFTIFMYKGQNS
jgi:ubiquinone/menaquinone biosynthesis C-methylase UbiE